MVAKLSFNHCTYLMAILIASCAIPGSFEFIETKPFFFNEVGNNAEYIIQIPNAKRYELALITDREIFPKEVVEMRPFEWRLHVSVSHEGEVVGNYVLGPLIQASELNQNHEYLSIISLGLLPSLKSHFSTKTFKVDVTVERVDERYTSENISVEVGIRPSPII